MKLVEAAETLGDVLKSRGQTATLLIIGGGALLLADQVARPTRDLDAVARLEAGEWVSARPFPPELDSAIKEVSTALSLPADWLNPGPAILFDRRLLPPGMITRARPLTFGGLTLYVAARVDLITLKVWSVTARRARWEVDKGDLKAMAPTKIELASALRWCATKDGRADFVAVDGLPLARELGVDLQESDV